MAFFFIFSPLKKQFLKDQKTLREGNRANTPKRSINAKESLSKVAISNPVFREIFLEF
jgi:hypothetical protein